MNIRDAFVPYRDGNGLMAPNPVPAGTIRGSDNGPMFTSEYYIILNRNWEMTNTDGIEYFDLIERCIGSDGYLHRAPGDLTQDEIDDYLGVLAGYAEFNDKPNFKLSFALHRFPQLVYAYYANQFTNPNLLFPLAIVTALILATSCIGKPKEDTDSRRLNWLLWQATKKKSWFCNIAGKFWHWRQSKIYGTKNVMSAVADTYYQPNGNNPFFTYWVD